jgi:hypothetical protein
MNTETVSLNLLKATLELQLRVHRLVQESGQQWLENATHAGNEGIAEASAEIEGLLDAETWQELATLPVQAFWRQLQLRVGDTRALTQVIVNNQMAFIQGLQQAIQHWQKSASEAVGQDALLPLPDTLKQWGAAWSAKQEKDSSSKTGGRDGG